MERVDLGGTRRKFALVSSSSSSYSDSDSDSSEELSDEGDGFSR